MRQNACFLYIEHIYIMYIFHIFTICTYLHIYIVPVGQPPQVPGGRALSQPMQHPSNRRLTRSDLRRSLIGKP